MLIGRLLLFVLLAVDWAADPHHGHSAFSRGLGSQEVVPTWTVQRHAIRLQIDLPRWLATGLDRAGIVPLAFPGPVALWASAPAPPPRPDSLYVLMSLQR